MFHTTAGRPNPPGSAYPATALPLLFAAAAVFLASLGTTGGPLGWNSVEKGEPLWVRGGWAARWAAIST